MRAENRVQSRVSMLSVVDVCQRSSSTYCQSKNAQEWLEERVVEILDDLSEQPLEFELLIIDDGSSDETSEIAKETGTTVPANFAS